MTMLIQSVKDGSGGAEEGYIMRRFQLGRSKLGDDREEYSLGGGAGGRFLELSHER